MNFVLIGYIMKWMPKGNGFALSDKHEAVFLRMSVQAIQWPRPLQLRKDSIPGLEAGINFTPLRTTSKLPPSPRLFKRWIALSTG